MHDYNECQGASNFLFSIYSDVSCLGFVCGIRISGLIPDSLFSRLKILNFTPLGCGLTAHACVLCRLYENENKPRARVNV